MAEKKLKAPKPWKPALACDIELDKISPELWASGLIVLPKIDGVRGLNRTGRLVGRSLEEHANTYITATFSDERYIGFDGELVTGLWTDGDLCRKTSGNCARGSATEDYGVVWYVFDYIVDGMLEKPYIERLQALTELVTQMNIGGNQRVLVVPHFIIHSEAEFIDMEESFLVEGFEGIIARDPNASYKSGRATVTMNNYLRLKQRIDFEFTITSFTEAMENTNEKKTNALGQSERSSHKENLVPKGMVGNINGSVLKDVLYRGKVMLVKGQEVTVGPGRMTHDERKRFWEAFGKGGEDDLKSGIGKALFMPHGQLDKPRIPTWDSCRSKQDMSA